MVSALLPGLSGLGLSPGWGHCIVFLSKCTADRLAWLVEYRTAVREVVGSNLGQTNTQGL